MSGRFFPLPKSKLLLFILGLEPFYFFSLKVPLILNLLLLLILFSFCVQFHHDLSYSQHWLIHNLPISFPIHSIKCEWNSGEEVITTSVVDNFLLLRLVVISELKTIIKFEHMYHFGMMNNNANIPVYIPVHTPEIGSRNISLRVLCGQILKTGANLFLKEHFLVL